MPMLLQSDNGAEFELSFIEDKLPELHDGMNDRSVLLVTFRVATEDEAWEESAPVINKYELTNLVEWLESVSGQRPDEAEMELLGPDLRFLVLKQEKESVKLRIEFHLDQRPPEYAVDSETERDHIDIKLSMEKVAMAAAALRRDLEGLDESEKDNLMGEENLGGVVNADEDLSIIDGESDEPPGAGTGEDNAGNR